jgi:preprotein translocase subunit SecY
VLETFRNVFKIKELRTRILFTLGILVVYRIGGHIPTPGIDGNALFSFFNKPGGGGGTLFGLFDLFVGGAFAKATIFSLGIMPYISASIILQLLGPVVPYLQRLQKEGEEGRRKITQYTRYGTVLIAALQAYGTSIFLQSLNAQTGTLIVANPGIGFQLLTMLTFTTGTIFIMWLGEKITEKGIGNGISLIIFIGIVARIIPGVFGEVQKIVYDPGRIAGAIIIIALMIAVIAAVIMVTRAQRRIPVQYAKRVVGRKIYGGQATHLPLSVNTAGVIPIIFAQSIMFAPQTLGTFFPGSGVAQFLNLHFNYTSILYNVVYGIVIVFFAFFYTAIVINPVQLADNMKSQGGFIPGKRPGKATADYIDKVLTRITLPGAIFFALIAVLPNFLMGYAGMRFYFGGTSVLILVGVALDTLQQIESHLLMRHYDGFIKKGKIRGRSY